MYVTQLFKFGGSIDAYNVGYNTGGIQYQTIRIVSGSTYDGALLQVQAGPGIQTGTSNIHYVNLMLSTNDPGWQIIDDESVVTADNTPKIYSGPNNNGTNIYFPPDGWTEISLVDQIGYTETSGPRAYTGKVTTLPTTFQGARLQVLDKSISVKDSSINNDITMSLDSNGNGIIGNKDSSNGKHIFIESDGNIILENDDGTASSKGVVINSNDGVFIVGNNYSHLSGNPSTGNITFKQYGLGQNNYIRFTSNDGTDGSVTNGKINCNGN